MTKTLRGASWDLSLDGLGKAGGLVWARAALPSTARHDSHTDVPRVPVPYSTPSKHRMLKAKLERGVAMSGWQRMSGRLNFRDEAARCRRLAKSMTDPRTVRELTELAEDYDTKAEAEERQAGLREPLAVKPVDGEVAILGPARLAGSLAPDAAIETAERLIEAGHEALWSGGEEPDDSPQA